MNNILKKIIVLNKTKSSYLIESNSYYNPYPGPKISA